MAFDRFFMLKCVVLFYSYVTCILGVLIIFGSLLVFINGQITAGLQSIFSAVFIIAWAFLGYYGVTKKRRCELLAFAIFLTISFILSLAMLAILPSEYGDPINSSQEMLMKMFNIEDAFKLRVMKILIGVEAIWKIFTSVCAFWLTSLIRIEQQNVLMNQIYKG